MIYLNEDSNYYIMIDKQGGVFGGYRIFEGINEVLDQFIQWGKDNEIESIEDYSISDCIFLWEIDIKKYNGKDFTDDLSEYELNYSNKTK